MPLLIRASNIDSSFIENASSVLNAPGYMQVTCILPEDSILKPSEIALTAYLVPEYTALPGITLFPATDETFMICPDSLSSICE